MGLCSPSFPPKLKIQHSLWKPDEWDQKSSHLCSSSVWHHQTWSIHNLRFCCQFRRKHFGRQYLWKPAGAKGWWPGPEIIFPENLFSLKTSKAGSPVTAWKGVAPKHFPTYYLKLANQFTFILGKAKHLFWQKKLEKCMYQGHDTACVHCKLSPLF